MQSLWNDHGSFVFDDQLLVGFEDKKLYNANSGLHSFTTVSTQRIVAVANKKLTDAGSDYNPAVRRKKRKADVKHKKLFDFNVNAGSDYESTAARKKRKAAISAKNSSNSRTVYASRQTIARRRPRVGGRFVKTQHAIVSRLDHELINV